MEGFQGEKVIVIGLCHVTRKDPDPGRKRDQDPQLLWHETGTPEKDPMKDFREKDLLKEPMIDHGIFVQEKDLLRMTKGTELTKMIGSEIGDPPLIYQSSVIEVFLHVEDGHSHVADQGHLHDVIDHDHQDDFHDLVSVTFHQKRGVSGPYRVTETGLDRLQH